jgi:DNA-directed RNA polymerase subunit beta'
MSKTFDQKGDFNAISLRLASPERIREWSYGEVTKPETINYRTGRSERGGLFDERIFGPEKDYECYCGKYRRIRYKDIICERCGVEVTHSIVRRERMGHIELASPIAHIWFVRSVPSRLGLFLDLSLSDLEKVIYFAGYIITKVDEKERERLVKELNDEFKQRSKTLQDERSREALKESLLTAKKNLEELRPGKVVDEVAYHRLSLKYGSAFEADIGADALYKICRQTDLGKLRLEIAKNLETARGPEKIKLQKRFNLVQSLERGGLRPEWMFLSAVPIIPPDLRPMVALDGGRHATSDVNDLYRRVINRNNRLRKLQELAAPEVILRNEKRILQEAVDALIDNSIRRSAGGVMNQSQRRPLKSLSDTLKGKQGRFRQNLLGKRVDYSGRSVIVVGPELRLNQCGIPKLLALELFRPFIIAKILETKLAYNIRGAGRLINDQVPEVWAILEEVIRDKYVLLNRAPTLHRLGIQAFQPVLIEGSAIQVHPLVCSAYNADFDGDQMAVHVPLSHAAQKECRELLAANRNILKPGSGNPIVNMKLDIILGCYWVTRLKEGATGEGQVFGSAREAIIAYHFGALDIRAKIKVASGADPKFGPAGTLVETSVGRLEFNAALPADVPYINKDINSKEMNALLERLIATHPLADVGLILDSIKRFGFRYATRSGTTWGLDDVVVPVGKKAVIAEAHKEIAQLEEQFNEGLLSDDEKYRLTIKTWTLAKNKIEKMLLEGLDADGPVAHMLWSGARGSTGQLSQMAGMKGQITSPSGRLIDIPIISSYKEGLTPLEYFISTHGSRKTLTDTALNTAKAGYLTRRLVYVSEDVVITGEDCGDEEGKLLSTKNLTGFNRTLSHLIWGRYLAADLKTADGKKLFGKGHLLTFEDGQTIDAAGLTEARVRTVLTCKQPRGICQHCYGLDLGRGTLAAIGEPVGIVAAQAIGEPGTQLTMRTKHSGGVDVGGDIVGGLPRVEEIFERRSPKNQAVIAEDDGLVTDLKVEPRGTTITVLSSQAREKPRARAKKAATKTAGQTSADGASVEYFAPRGREVLVKEGENVKSGQLLTDGAADLQLLFKWAGRAAVEEYIINEINKIYELQGASISRKHLEIIIRQMFSRRRVKQAGDSRFEVGEVVDVVELEEANAEIKARSPEGALASGDTVLLGLSEVSLTTPSFIAAVAFAQSTRTLIKTALRGGLDRLRGLKENVIIGRLIPAGTGLVKDYAPPASSV